MINSAINNWLKMVKTLPADELQALQIAHQWVLDRIDYQKETGNWWQAPQETLSKGSGDCEDFAILWFFTLRAYGFEPRRVRLAHLKIAPGLSHMVCLAFIENGSDWWALDNTDSAPRIFTGTPIYQINEQGLWVQDRMKSTISRQWDRVLGQIADLDGQFAVDMSGS